ncbi:outer membrane beta-barrel protein [Hymenobacter sp. HMF4947]|uniref:Outer membrane beta-barrel protein n=1 Tax=Hymenobacter ginkgonis TaxID=2682976 RepID=A0A7K1TDM9_9BACT|nr:porin family protein [Hymenobacter ginkgonis]MVN76515.1 outer membrane beta-barrel protein [Hymenobacter ginkgonis]
MKSLALSFVTALVLLLGVAPQAHAQFGIKGGVNWAELQGRSGEDASYKTFYHVGILYQAHLIGPLSIQPEVQYSVQGGNLKGAFTDYDSKLHYFTVPVLAKVTVGPIFVEAGPQFGYLVSANQDGKVQISSTNGSASYGQVNQSATDQYKRTEFSLAAGAGLKFSALSIGGRYVAGLNDINDVKTLSGINDPRLKNRVFQLYASLQFGK